MRVIPARSPDGELPAPRGGDTPRQKARRSIQTSAGHSLNRNATLRVAECRQLCELPARCRRRGALLPLRSGPFSRLETEFADG